MVPTVWKWQYDGGIGKGNTTQLAHVDTVVHEVVKHVRKEFRQFAEILEVETG